jgi:O-antigen ligase
VTTMNVREARRGVAAAPATAGGRHLKVELDPFRVCIFALMLLNVGRIHQHFPFLAALRPALVLVVLTAVYAMFQPRFIRAENVFAAWMPKAFLALGILACAGAPFGLSLGGSGRFILEDYSKVLVFAFLLVIAIRRTADLFTLVWAYVLSAGILVWMSMFVFGLQRGGGAAARLSNLYTFDANDVGLVLIVGLALTILTFQTSSRRGKVVSGVVLAGIGATIARTGSRGAFLGLLACGLVLLFALHSVSLVKRLGFVAVTIVALLIAAPEGYWEQMRTLTNPTADYNWDSKEGRKQVAARGIDYMLTHPIFGLGINNFWRAECIESEKARSHLIGTGIRCTPPHNSYVQAGAELGIPGLILWSSLVFGGIGWMVRLRRRVPKAWARGDPEERFLYLAPLYLMLAMIGFAVTSFFLTFAWEDIVYIIGALMTGLYISIRDKLRRKGAQPASPARPTRRRRGAPVEPRFIAAPAAPAQ